MFIFTEEGYFTINYLDDIGSAESEEKAWKSFHALQNLLVTVGLQEAANKACPPCTQMVFLGIEVNTITFTPRIPKEKLLKILDVLSKWEVKTVANKKQVQQLAGLLNFACRCIKSGRIYLSRILNFLRSLPSSGSRTIPEETLQDITWWREFAPQYNGVSLMLEDSWGLPDLLLSTDSCLTGGGGFTGQEFFHFEFDEEFKPVCTDINQMECVVLVVALKLWAKDFPRKKLVLQCDNAVTVQAINSGRSKNTVIQKCLRERHKITALTSCDVKTMHLVSSTNWIVDSLSRWHLHPKFKKRFEQDTSNLQLIERKLNKGLWDFIYRK